MCQTLFIDWVSFFSAPYTRLDIRGYQKSYKANAYVR